MQFPYRADEFAHLGTRIRQAMSEIYVGLRKRLTIRDNVNTLLVSHTFGGTPDTTEDVDISALDLDWVPDYVITVETDDGAAVYPNDAAHTSWSTTTLKLKSSKAGTAWVGMVF